MGSWLINSCGRSAGGGPVGCRGNWGADFEPAGGGRGRPPRGVSACGDLRVGRSISGGFGRDADPLEQGGQAIEILASLIVDDDLAAIRVPSPDQDRGAQVAMKPLFELEKMGGPGHHLMTGVFSDPGAGGSGDSGGHERLGLADGEVFGDDSLAGRGLAFGVGKAQECAGVTLGDFIAADGVQDVVREVEEANQVGDRRSIDAQDGRRALPGCRRSARDIR